MGEVPTHMFSVREVPWHGIGTIVDECVTAREALVLAQLDWDVDLYPVYFNHGDPYDMVEIPDQFAVTRRQDKRVFQICGKDYAPHQNFKSFEFMDNLVDSGDAKYETAGDLENGKKVFIVARIARDILIGGVDPVDLYLVLINSHDGTMKFQVMATPIRVVCENTMNMAIRDCISRWSTAHTGDIDGRVIEARQTLDLTFAFADQFEAQMNGLINDQFTKRDFEVMVKALFPGKKEQVDRFTAEQYALIGCFESSPTLDDSYRYTSWGALNAVREYDDWGKEFRASASKSEDEQRVVRTWFGPNVARSTKVLAYLQDPPF